MVWKKIQEGPLTAVRIPSPLLFLINTRHILFTAENAQYPRTAPSQCPQGWHVTRRALLYFFQTWKLYMDVDLAR